MKYNPNLDRDSRYISIETMTPGCEFEFKGTLRCPSPSYKIELSNTELQHLAQRLMIKFHAALYEETKSILELVPNKQLDIK